MDWFGFGLDAIHIERSQIGSYTADQLPYSDTISYNHKIYNKEVTVKSKLLMVIMKLIVVATVVNSSSSSTSSSVQ